MCSLLDAHLSRIGYGVTTAATAETALELLSQGTFDVVISDIRLPGMQGTDFLKAVKQQAPDAEVVVMTGYPCLETAIECLRLGATDFVHKPFQLEEIRLTLARAVEHRRLRASTALFQASQVIFSARDTERLPELITNVAMQVMQADDVSLMLPDESGLLFLAHSQGVGPRIPEGEAEQSRRRETLGPGLAQQVAETRQPMVIAGNSNNEGEERNWRNIQCSIIYPLCSGDRLLGVLNLNRIGQSRPFHKADVQRAGVLAGQVVLALENARLVRRLLVSERLASVGQVAAGVVHEIKQPVTWLTSNLAHLERRFADLEERVERLEAERVEPSVLQTREAGHFPWSLGSGPALLSEIKESLSEAQEGVHRINEIVLDMQAMSRTDGRRESTFDLNDAIRSAIRVTRSTLRRSAARLSVELSEAGQISGVPGRLSQVFVNLLANAAQAVASTGRPGTVSVKTHLTEHEVIAEVSDDGPGVDPQVLPHLFDPFFTTRAQEGTGLGLPISREIVRRAGGDLTITHDGGRGAGCGAVFIVRLPRAAKRISAQDTSRTSAFDSLVGLEPPEPGAQPPALRMTQDDLVVQTVARLDVDPTPMSHDPAEDTLPGVAMNLLPPEGS